MINCECPCCTEEVELTQNNVGEDNALVCICGEKIWLEVRTRPPADEE